MWGLTKLPTKSEAEMQMKRGCLRSLTNSKCKNNSMLGICSRSKIYIETCVYAQDSGSVQMALIHANIKA